jgi:hypothetical protein
VEYALKDMKTKRAPGQESLGILKLWAMQMMDNFYKGELNLSKINYETIFHLPKLKEVATIKQYMPICILNVFYKLFTRVLAIRLMEVADDIISKNQTAFIKGMNILEGIMVLHKVIHEMR